MKLKSGLQRLGCCSPASALPRSDRWRGTRLFLASPDLVVSSPGFHRGRIPISVLEGRVEDDEVVVQVRIPPVAEPSVLVAEYLLFYHATSEQWTPVRLAGVAEDFVVWLSIRFVLNQSTSLNRRLLKQIPLLCSRASSSLPSDSASMRLM